MNKTSESLLSKFYEIIKVTCCIVHADGTVLLSVPEQENAVLPAGFIQLCIQDFLAQGRDIQHPQIVVMDPTYFLGIAQIGENEFMIFGPVSPIKQIPEEIRRFSTGFQLDDHLSAFVNTVARTPMMGYRAFTGAFCVAIFLAGGPDIPGEKVILSNNALNHRPSDESVQEELFLSRENQLAHAAYSFESSLMDAVRAGDGKLLTERAMKPFAGRAGTMSNDVIRQERYLFIAALATATRAAIEGGAPEEEAYTLSDTYSLKMDALTNLRDITMLSYSMLLDFCNLVAKYKAAAEYSKPVKKCLEYISNHLHDDITLENLATLTGLCTRVISKKFRQETGLSVALYVQKQKIEEAKFLLRHTTYTYSEISNYLNFCTQSYFTKIFKDTVGMTPQKYRERK